MAKCVVKQVETEYTLTLTEEEAIAVLILTGRCLAEGPAYAVFNTLHNEVPYEEQFKYKYSDHGGLPRIVKR